MSIKDTKMLNFSERPFAPWFFDEDEDDASAFYDRQWEIKRDLDAATRFFTRVEQRVLFPIDEFLRVEIPYVVDARLKDAAERFNAIAERITAEGGTLTHHPHTEIGPYRETVQHIAMMPFGSGRVVYRVLWIEDVTGTHEDDIK